ncbi:MAG: PQQ-like beta-propeller repeat protein [Thermoanaerobaculia bacterium]|nr:PQQ-like beta-propeller repeat protein [Thermoanaerobaculia bacterium]
MVPRNLRSLLQNFPTVRPPAAQRAPHWAALIAMAGISILAASSAVARPADNWPQWRGPLATGEAPTASPPVTWDEQHNVRWKIPLPGLGHSTPVVWGDLLFLTAAVPVGELIPARHDSAHGAHDGLPVTRKQQFVTLAVDRATGRIVWQTTLHEELPHEGGHASGSLASASPVTDGKLVFAFFGSRGLFALNLEGEVQWKSDLGDMETKHAHGEGSSPVLYGDTLVVNWDHEGQSFIVAFDKATGRERWRMPRDEVTSWATPIVVVVDGKPQVIVSATGRIRGYDLATGAIVWEWGGLSANVVATPVAADGFVYAGSSYDTRSMVAIRLSRAKGDITGTDQVAWVRTRGTPYVPSPLLYGDALYFLGHYQALLTRLEAKSGREVPGTVRLPELRNIYASPVGAAGRVYITDRNGVTVVLNHAEKTEVLAVNRLDDQFSASAAVVGDAIYLRGERFLYCLAES